MIKGILNAAPSINKNAIRYSQFYFLEDAGRKTDTYAIKYVMKGTEFYKTDKQAFELNAGNFLLLNPETFYLTYLEGKELTEGLCIDLDKDLLRKVYSDMMLSNEKLLDDPYFLLNEPDLIEESYRSDSNYLSNRLLQIGSAVMKHKGFLNGITEEHYFSLAEALIIDHLRVSKEIRNIKVKKLSVQKELHKKISLVQSYINEQYNEDLSIERLSFIAQMSPFHFLRTFKQVFNVSPHQYILCKRLDESYKLLISKKNSVTDVANNCGFHDIFSFSKAFKKKFGVAPSFYKN